MKALITNNSNLLFQIEGIYFFTDMNFNLRSFTDFGEYKRLEGLGAEIYTVENQENEAKVLSIFKQRSRFQLNTSQKNSILQRIFSAYHLDDKPYFNRIEVVERQSIENFRKKIFFGPYRVSSGGLKWIVVGANHREDEAPEGKMIYIIPSFGEKLDKFYFLLKKYLRELNFVLEKADKNGSLDITSIKEHFSNVFRETPVNF